MLHQVERVDARCVSCECATISLSRCDIDPTEELFEDGWFCEGCVILLAIFYIFGLDFFAFANSGQ